MFLSGKQETYFSLIFQTIGLFFADFLLLGRFIPKYYVILDRKSNLSLYKGSSGDWEMSRVTFSFAVGN